MNRRIIVALILVMVAGASMSVSAVELSGQLWSITDRMYFPSLMYSGKFALLEMGPVKVAVEGRYAGDHVDINQLGRLLARKLDEESVADLDDFTLLVGFRGGANIDWPVYKRISLLATIGYQVVGDMSKRVGTGGDADVFDYGLYGGIIYGGGIGIELVPGLKLAGVYEQGSTLSGLYVADTSAAEVAWRGVDISVQYRIPLVLAKAGFRWENVDTPDDGGYSLSGFYIGAGIHF